MTRAPRACAVAIGVFLGGPAAAQADGAPDGGAPPGAAAVDGGAPGLSAADQQALEKALGADAAARGGAPPAPPSPAGAPGAAAAPAAPAPADPLATATGALRRAFQSLNPDLSAIVDFAAGWYRGAMVRSGDDPGDTGFNLQEVEIALSATVDPYFRADVYLTIPNASGLEVEEAFLTTTSLPGSLQLRAGIFRAAFGRQNTQHLHVQDFTRRPQLNALLLGPDGMRAPGLELSWLVPVPFYLSLTAAAFSVAPADGALEPLRSFGGGSRSDFTYLGNLKTFAPLSENTSLLLGLSFATGLTSTQRVNIDGPAIVPERSYLYGADLYLKWKPPNVSRTYMSLGWTTEFVLRQLPSSNLVEGALYSQLAWQVARRWVIGVRGELDGLPQGVNVPRQYAGAASLTWNLSEFARARLYGEARHTPDGQPAIGFIPAVAAGTAYSAFLQLEASIGAHGAHAY